MPKIFKKDLINLIKNGRIKGLFHYDGIVFFNKFDFLLIKQNESKAKKIS